MFHGIVDEIFNRLKHQSFIPPYHEGLDGITVQPDRPAFGHRLVQCHGLFDHVVQTAVERVVKALDLPRRRDLVALNSNLQRVADAIEALDANRRLDVEKEPDSKSSARKSD